VIFVTVGTNEAPFDRLLEAFDRLEREEHLVIQCGASSVRPAGAHCLDFISFAELVEHVRAARVVVTHAGVGSVAVALANGKRPLVVPRLAKFGEAVDDHQVAFARRFATGGQVRLLEDLDALRSALDQDGSAADIDEPQGALAAEIRAYIDAVVGPSQQRLVPDPR
jgi:UDP-N-acetylglucosamine transferase subunit ALG13